LSNLKTQALIRVTGTSDKELVELSRQGDRTAFRMLVVRYEVRVAGIVKGMLGDGPESADVAQEVFIRFFRSLPEFRGEASLGTYLGRIAINLSLNALKQRQRNQGRYQGMEAEAVATGSREEEMRSEAREIVAKALAQLEPDFRAVIILRLIEGYSTQEAAALLDIPVGTVLSRLSRGQEKLKGIIEKLMQ
jgi:RNA polymerase sigma-70 factor, ECF subfamily